MDITLTDLEEAINYWRTQKPSTGEERALSPEVNTLAKVYAVMIYEQQRTMTRERLSPEAAHLLDAWRATRNPS